jgi:hypothetical protein
MMRGGPARQRLGGPLHEESRHAEPLSADALEIEVRRAGAGDDDEVDPRRHEGRPRAEAFTAETLDAVSLHCAAHATTHDQAEPWRPRLALRSQEQREMRRPDPARRGIVLRADELGVPWEPTIRSERHGSASLDRFSTGRLSSARNFDRARRRYFL